MMKWLNMLYYIEVRQRELEHKINELDKKITVLQETLNKKVIVGSNHSSND